MRKSKRSKIDRLLKEYKSLEELYKNFSHKIKFILENILNENDFRYQTITCREKQEKSLKDKLEKAQTVKLIKSIDDLSGCRIIFYFAQDVEKIIPYLHNEFEVVKQNLKYSEDNYNALHLIVKLKKDRLKLSEYAKFNDLKCEIQITTVLFHAWSEIAHDIIYKRKESLSEFDKPAFNSIESRFLSAMKDHIKPAQHDFDFISKDIERITQGKNVFDHSFLKSLVNSKTNNEIYQKLANLLKYIGQFGDKTPRELKIIEVIKKTLEKSRTLKKEPIKTAFGPSPGFNYTDVVRICLEILDVLKFAYPKEVFKILSDLSINKNNQIRKKSLDVVSKMAECIFIPKKYKIYYHLQFFILDEIEKWNNKKLMSHLDFILEITEKLLSPDYKGESWENDTLFFHHGALPASNIVTRIRKRTLNILKNIYPLSTTLSEKQQILKSLKKATHKPLYRDFTPELEKIILNNTNFVIDFYLSVVKKEDPEIIRAIEEQSYWLPKRFKKGLKGLSKLKSIINTNKEYKIYKVVVGYGYHRFDESSVEMIEKEKNREMDEYIKQITQNNFTQWKKRILSIVKKDEYIDSTIGFHNFRNFLYKLGEKKPQIAKKLISENEKELEHVLIYLISGIWKSSQKENIKRILESWIKCGKHLSTCALVFDYVGEIDKSLLEKIYKKAKEKNDIDTFTNIIKSIVGNFKHSQIGKSIFIDCFKELRKYKNYSGINHISYRGDEILKTLTKSDWGIILENLLYVSNINYQLENCLSIVAEKYPKKLIEFFCKRVKIQLEKKREKNYDAIPFVFHKLNKHLNQSHKIIIEEILKWFNENHWLFKYEGGRLLKLIFPNFHPELEKQLINLIKSGEENKAKVVLRILLSYKYNNKRFLHNVCKEFIKKHKKKYQQDMFMVLSQTGVVTGEYGFVEAYKRKKQEKETRD